MTILYNDAETKLLDYWLYQKLHIQEHQKIKYVLNPDIVNVFDSTSFEKSAEGVWCPHC